MHIDLELIIQCKKDSKAAQKKLYDQCKQYWYAICLRYLNKQEDSLDVLQNSLIKIFTKIDQFDPKRGHFKGWSNKIVVNECIMFQRKYWKTEEVSQFNLEVLDVNCEPAAYSNLRMEELTKLIQGLPTGYRIVFNLYVIEGYNHNEIAEKLDISVGTSKSQLFKAKNLLKKKLEHSELRETRMIS